MVSIKGIQEFISIIFYRHGLMCASHPSLYIFGVIVSFIFLCHPLLDFRFPENPPLEYITHIKNYSIPEQNIFEKLNTLNEDSSQPPLWYFKPPMAYIQQILVNGYANLPNNIPDLKLFLDTSFTITEHINNYVHIESKSGKKISLSDVCLQMGETVLEAKSYLKNVLPQYNCLIISPSRYWHIDKFNILSEKEIIESINKKHGNIFDSAPTLKDILFGVPNVKGSGKASIPYTYAVTILFKDFNKEYLAGLEENLKKFYSVHINKTLDYIVHVFYEKNNYLIEYTPLIFAYFILCLYLYFSVRKIEMVKSKWGLALSAVISVVASLFMSVSLCLLFGRTPNLKGSEIFPYLAIVIGLENILIITKSVVSTPVHLEVKMRIAQGLQKESWSIFKNLLAELLLLFFGFLTFVPDIQEFCLFALLGIVSDFMLQMFFFTTVLSVDIRRMELSDLHNSSYMIQRRKSSLKSEFNLSNAQNDDVFLEHFESEKDEELPRRMRFNNSWTRYRILHRGIMISVIIWIFLLVYKTYLFEDEALYSEIITENKNYLNPTFLSPQVTNFLPDGWVPFEMDNASGTELFKKFESEEDNWRLLSGNHWTTLFGYYNISLYGSYLSILPTMHISIPIKSDFKTMLSPNLNILNFDRWKFANVKAAALANHSLTFLQRIVRYPRSQLEYVITVLLLIVSVVMLSCVMTLSVKFWCLETTSMWKRREKNIVKFVAPMVLKKHTHVIECIAIDANILASSSLVGDICIWDLQVGECLHHISRNRDLKIKNIENLNEEIFGNDVNEDTVDIRKRKLFKNLPDFSDSIITNFNTCNSSQISNNNCYNFSAIVKNTHCFDFDDHKGQIAGTPIWCMQIKGSVLTAGCSDGSIEIWDIISGNQMGTIKESDAGVTCMNMVTGFLISAYIDGYLDFWSLGVSMTSLLNCSNNAMLQNFKINRILAHHGIINCTLPYNQYIVTGSQDHTVKIFQLEDGKLVSTLFGHEAEVTFLLFNKAHNCIISASNDNTLRIWDATAYNCMHILLTQNGQTNICINDDIHQNSILSTITGIAAVNDKVACLSTDDKMCLWNITNGKIVKNVNLEASNSHLSTLLDSLFVTGGQATLSIWNEDNGQLISQFILQNSSQDFLHSICQILSTDLCTIICSSGPHLHVLRLDAKSKKNLK